MSTFNLWTKEDIKLLKQYFLKGESIKIIARKLQRTPSALNKALTRFGIRSLKKTRKTKPVSSLSQLFSISKNKKERLSFQETPWVTLHEVIDYLRQKGFWVKSAKGQESKKEFFINKEPISPLSLLLRANRLRDEQGEVPFMVKNVTW